MVNLSAVSLDTRAWSGTRSIHSGNYAKARGNSSVANCPTTLIPLSRSGESLAEFALAEARYVSTCGTMQSLGTLPAHLAESHWWQAGWMLLMWSVPPRARGMMWSRVQTWRYRRSGRGGMFSQVRLQIEQWSNEARRANHSGWV